MHDYPLPPPELRRLKAFLARQEEGARLSRANPPDILPLDRHLPVLNWTLMGIPLKTFVVFFGVNWAVSAIIDAFQEPKK